MQKFHSEAEFGQQQWRISLVREIPKIKHSKMSVIAATKSHMFMLCETENTLSGHPKDEREKKTSEILYWGRHSSNVNEERS